MAENKHITLTQLKKLALRGKADTLDLIIKVLEGNQHVGITVALPAAAWSGRAQTVKHESLLADSNYWYLVCGDADCFMACSDAGVKADNITVNGEAVFRCEITPDEDLTVNIIRLEVETDEQQS